MNIRFLLPLSLILVAPAIRAPLTAGPSAAVIEASGVTKEIVTPSAEFFEDSSASVTPRQVIGADCAARFRSPAQTMFFSPWSTSAIWMRLTLSNSTADTADKLLVTDCQFIDTMETYLADSGSLRFIQRTGRHFAFNRRPLRYRTFGVAIRLAPHTVMTVYQRIRSTEVLTAVVYLWDPEAFYRDHRSILLLYGIFYGLCGAVFLITIVLYVSSRNRWYLYYGLMILFMHVLFTMGRQGVSQEFLFPAWPVFATLAHLSFASLGQVFSLLLTKSFLQFRIRSRFWKSFFYGQIVLLSVTAVLPFVLGYQQVSVFLTNVSCLPFVTVLAINILAVVQGNRSAVYFLVAWICHLAGASTIILRSWGALSNPLIMDHGYQICITVELFLISIAMAYRMCVQRQEIVLARSESLRVKNVSIDNLKKTILSRIQELQARVNPDFLYNALNAISHQTHVDPETANKDLEKLSRFYRLVLGFSRRKQVSLSEEIELVQLYMHFEKTRFGSRVSFSMDVDKRLYDIQVPGLLIQPLVENAVEHGILPRACGGHVYLSVAHNGNCLAITVKDDGVGLREPFTSGNSLGSIRERLELLYEDRFTMDIQNALGITVTVVMPFSEGIAVNSSAEKS